MVCITPTADRRLLPRQSHQRDLADRRHLGEAIARAQPIVEVGDRQDRGQAPHLFVKRARFVFPAVPDIGHNCGGAAAQQVAFAFAGIGGQLLGMAVDRLAGAITPHGDVQPGWPIGRPAHRRERDDRFLAAVAAGDRGHRRGFAGARLIGIERGNIPGIAERHEEA